MKKNLLILLSLFACITNSIAQTAAKSRLVGASYYGYDVSAGRFYMIDTSSNTYTGSRGGDLKDPFLSFDGSTAWRYDTTTKTLTKRYGVIQSFDTKNRRTGFTDLLWNTTISAWDYNNNNIYTYDASSNLLTTVNQQWDKTVGWSNYLRYTSTYDTKNNQTSYTTESWDAGSSTWVGTDKFLYTYDAANNQTIRIYQHWDGGSSTWVNQFRDSFIFSATNKKVFYDYNTWDVASASWKNSAIVNYTYNSSDYLIQTQYQYWNSTTASYYNVLNFLYTNDASGRPIQAVNQQWDNNKSSWLNIIQTFSTYDVKGNLLAEELQRWDTTTAAWHKAYIECSTFDAAGDTLVFIYAPWDSATHTWDSSERTRYTYNSYNQMTSYVTDVTDHAGGWVYSNVDVIQNYYYEDYIPTAVHEVSDKGGVLQLYPVPANDMLSINLKWDNAQPFTSSIYDMQGRVWENGTHAAATDYTERFSVQNLPSGNYFIQFKGSQDGRIVRQFTVVH